MGKRYTEQEKHRIQELATQGHTDESIAQQLGRSTNAIRNIRHRNNLKPSQKQTISQIMQEKQTLTQQIQELQYKVRQINSVKVKLSQTKLIDERTFYKRIETALIRLKNQKPELFKITEQEQINQITAQLASSFLRWLIE